MANNNKTNGKDYEQEIRSRMRDLSQIRESRKRDCNHKPNNHGRVISVHDSKINVPGKKDMPDTTVVCTRCEKVFDSSSYRPDETDAAIYMLNSIAEQVKLNANLTDEDKAFLDGYYEALDTVSQFITYYNNMVEKLANGGGRNKQRNNQNKGHLGLNSGMFGGRGF